MILLSGPNISGNEWKYVKDCLDTAWVSSVGSYVDQFERMVAEYAGARYGVATSSGTTALHVALLLEGVEAGDYVIVPNLTFVASVNTIKYVGASPILIDAYEDTWQMDLGLLESFLEEEAEHRDGRLVLKKDGRPIKVIMPVHVLGHLGDVEHLLRISERYGLPVIEDATEAMGSYYKDQHAGSFGKMGCFSFNGNKIITCGGGGVLVTDDEDLAKRAKHLTTQAKADSFEYYHDEVGYNYRLVNVSAAIGVAQMEQLPDFVRRKHEIADFYREALSGVGDIRFQEVHADTRPNWWLFTIRTERQRAVLEHLNAHKMQSRPFWVPMNQLPVCRGDLFVGPHNISDRIYRECLSIPCSTNITDEELQSIAARIKELY